MAEPEVTSRTSSDCTDSLDAEKRRKVVRKKSAGVVATKTEEVVVSSSSKSVVETTSTTTTTSSRMSAKTLQQKTVTHQRNGVTSPQPPPPAPAAVTAAATNGVQKPTSLPADLLMSPSDAPLTTISTETLTPNTKTNLNSESTNGDNHVTIDEIEGVKIDKSRLTRTFSQTPADQDKTSVCRICDKQVFHMEKIKAEKSVFHKTCFKCKECAKQLNVDNFSSHEGNLYCKLHFKSLFQPKAVFDEEPVRRKKPELIIKENTPAELPPDVVRSTDKPSYGLEEIPSMRNIKSRFEGADANGDDSVGSAVPIKRSESILSKMARFQNLANDNGHYEESESSEEEGEGDDDADGEISVIKESRKKEKMSFTGMSELKTQWEGMNNGKGEHGRERQEEMSKVRMKICHGKNNLRALYEGALQEGQQASQPREAFPVEIISSRAQSLRHKFETGELDPEGEEDEREEARRREKEEDLSVVKEPAIATDARNLFKQMDAEVSRNGGSQATTPSSRTDRWSRFSTQSSVTSDTEIVRHGEPDDDVVIETRDVSAKFRFFENFEAAVPQQEKKRFAITPPREVREETSPERNVARDPNVVRSGEAEEVIVTDTARKMLNKFRELESAAATGDDSTTGPPLPKPMKRITPPREYTAPGSNDDSVDAPRDPNIVRACDKIEDDFLVQATQHQQAKSLRAKFERWVEDEDVDKENRRNGVEDQEMLQASELKAKALRAQFESLQDENSRKASAGENKAKPKVNRFV